MGGRLSSGKHRRREVVYWEKTGKDKRNRVILTNPTEILARWVEKQTETLNAENTVVRTDVQLKTDRPLILGSIVRLGSLAALPDPLPSISSGLFEVVLNRKVPNLKDNETRYTVFLVRYTDTLPTVE